jgi:hypothetical protein
VEKLLNNFENLNIRNSYKNLKFKFERLISWAEKAMRKYSCPSFVLGLIIGNIFPVIFDII